MSPVAAAAPGADCSAPGPDPSPAPAVDVQFEFAHRLATVAEYRDDATGTHAARVADISRRIAEQLALPAESIRLIELAAPLHDLGKVAIPDAILLKPGALDLQERAAMEEHTLIGARMLEGSSMPVLQVARAIAISHHERWDGTGYPHRLDGPRIPLPGRIVAIADVFDALTSDRPYKRAWPLSLALREIGALRGSHFDPVIADAFLRLDHAALLDVA